MKFIFPKNYKFNNKLFGFIDYPTAIINIVYFFILYFLLNLVFSSINIKIVFFMTLYLPILLISVVGFGNESVILMIYYILKFLIKPKLYLYK